MNDSDRHPRDDELLSALIDGELPADEAARLKERLALEPSLARRHEQLLSANTLVAGVHAPIVEEPLPDRVTRLLRPAPPAAIATPRFGWSHAWTGLAAMAAGLLIATVVLTRPGGDDPTAFLSAGRVSAGTPFHDVLDGTSSGDTRALAAGWTAAPRFSYVEPDGDPCRRVDLRSARATIETVACRRDGEWRIELVAYGPPPPPEGHFAAAAGDSKIDAAVDGEPLGESEERRWIERGWR